MTAFDPGYGQPPFRNLCETYPGPAVYPAAAFRIEWGPVFHRGRLDGTATLLVIGQDPAQHEAITRRILVGVAGHRTQGFLAKLGLTRSYVLINTFLYSVYGQQGGNQHMNDAAIAAYRHQWIDAIVASSSIKAVVALGGLADDAFTKWKATATGAAFNGVYAHITHPTAPRTPADTKALLQNWNAALQTLKPAITTPDVPTPLVLYGDDFKAAELLAIPPDDLPAGLPPWMGSVDAWAARTGHDATTKRYTITVSAPHG